MNVVEMTMLRWISLMRTESMKNEYVRNSKGEASIMDKMRENRLKWFSYVMRIEDSKS